MYRFYYAFLGSSFPSLWYLPGADRSNLNNCSHALNEANPHFGGWRRTVVHLFSYKEIYFNEQLAGLFIGALPDPNQITDVLLSFMEGFKIHKRIAH